jgi:hypothetical protein
MPRVRLSEGCASSRCMLCTCRVTSWGHMQSSVLDLSSHPCCHAVLFDAGAESMHAGRLRAGLQSFIAGTTDFAVSGFPLTGPQRGALEPPHNRCLPAVQSCFFAAAAGKDWALINGRMPGPAGGAHWCWNVVSCSPSPPMHPGVFKGSRAWQGHKQGRGRMHLGCSVKHAPCMRAGARWSSPLRPPSWRSRTASRM